MANKGSPFERQVAKRLSLWWTNGEDDYVFWRADTSGARATVRHRKGLSTGGHCGDVCAIDGRGQPLVRLVTIEVKRGYNKTATLSGPIDRSPKCRQAKDKPARTLDEFVRQARLATARAGTLYWLLIHRRDGCVAVAYMPSALFWALKKVGAFARRPLPLARLFYADRDFQVVDVTAVTLDDFLKHVNPSHVRKLYKESKRGHSS